MPDPDPAPRDISVLFVCLGNICRSPLAEGVFAALLDEEGIGERFTVDSAGTGSWHVGDPADPRSAAVARAHGIELVGRARRVTPTDLEEFDWVIAMDGSNLRSLEAMTGPATRAKLSLLREFDDEADDEDVPDPYYGGPSGFDVVYDIVDRSCRNLLGQLLSEGR